MTHPYLIPSHPDSKDFVAALERYAREKTLVQFERLSGMQTYTFAGKIVSVTPAEDRVLVWRDDREPQSYWIRYLFRIVDPEGKTTENAAALAKHNQAIEHRKQRAADGYRVLVDPSFIPAARYETSSMAGKVSGTINGRECEFFVFKGKNSKPSLAVVYARNEAAAAKCMRLLDVETSTWDIFASYLQAHFFWPA